MAESVNESSEVNEQPINLNDPSNLLSEQRAAGVLDFSNKTFSNVFLPDKDFNGAIFKNAVLKYALFDGSSFVGADFSGADLTGASLNHADFSKAILVGANLSDTDIIDSNLVEANLSHTNLSNSDLRWSNLRKANLVGADLSGAHLLWAELSDAVLSKDTKLKGTLVQNFDLDKAKLNNANKEQAKLSDIPSSKELLSRGLEQMLRDLDENESPSQCLITSLKLKNLLSYSENGEPIELRTLNVLIGPNSSGKSNLLEAISLLQATPKDFTVPFRKGGTVNEWLWKGNKKNNSVSEIELVVNYPGGFKPLHYRIGLNLRGQRLEIVEEVIENERANRNTAEPYFFYRFQRGLPTINIKTEKETRPGKYSRNRRYLRREDINPEQSILSQRKEPDFYPELAYLSNQFSKIVLYRNFDLRALRNWQPADLPNNFLLEDGSNLGLVLSDLSNRPKAKKLIIQELKKFYEAAEDITTKTQVNSIQVAIQEEGLDQSIPATRLSDGTLRYLCLLAILCHPTPPPLICIEEPEIGLHPDALHNIAKLLIQASKRTQLIVTTHSDILVSALSEVPESIVVCERDNEGTHLRRLESKKLNEWLEKYSLGDLWLRGEIGGIQ